MPQDNLRVKQPLIIQEIPLTEEQKQAYRDQQNYADLIRRQGTLSPDFGNNYFATNSYYQKHTTPEQKAVHQQATEEKKARDIERALNVSEVLFPSTWWNGVTTWTGNENLNINNPSAKLAFDLITPFGASLLSNSVKGGIRLGQGIVNTTSRKTLFNRLAHPIETVKFAKINNATENLLRQTYPQSEKMIQGYRPVIKNTKYYNGNPHGENNGLYFLGDEIIGLGGNKKLGNTVTMWDRAHEFGHVVDAGQKTMQKKPFTGIKGWRYGNETSPNLLAEEFASDVLATNLFPNTKPGLSHFDIDSYIARQNAVRGISYGDIYVPGKNNIISFNLGKTTPEQWTAAQDAAIARGDMDEAQRLRDLHASVNGYNSSLSLYHGSPKNFNEFKAVPNFEGYRDYLSHFSVNPDISSKFGDVRRFYTNVKNPLRVADQGAIWNPSNLANELGIQPKYVKDPLEPYWREFQNIKGRDMYKEANRKFMENELKGDAYVYDNVVEGGGDSYAIPTSRQVKLADAVTYDNNGIRIPLGKRDNFNINDIRYGIVPWFLAGTTAAALYNKPLGTSKLSEIQ